MLYLHPSFIQSVCRNHDFATGTLSSLIHRLQRAVEDELHVSKGWHAYEICDGVANLAAEHHNLMMAVSLIHSLLKCWIHALC